MVQAESKSLFRLDSMDTGEKLLRSDGAVEGFARFQAIITAVAGNFSSSCGGSRVGCRPSRRRPACLYRSGRPAFAEVPQQRCAPAFPCFGIRDHVAQLLVRDPLFAFAFFLD